MLTAVGHLGWDVIEGVGASSRHMGGSLFHFLNGMAFTCTPCRAVTWTTSEVAYAADSALPPWIMVNNLPVNRPPTFNIAYDGETLARFDIENIEMPEVTPRRLGHLEDIHFCAMPPSDVVAILAEAKPAHWSVQFHSAVLSHASDFERLPVKPDLAFCTSSEYDALSAVVSALPSTTWIVTDRDRVAAMREDRVVALFEFPPYEFATDTTGAGDVLAGSIVGSLRRGLPLQLALRFATGVVATSLGDFSSDGLSGWWGAAGRVTRLAHHQNWSP